MRSPLRKMRAGLARTASVVFLLAGTTAAAQTTGTVSGTVTDAVTGRPVDGVQVYVVGRDLGTLTNALGQYQLIVRAGEIELRTRRVGFASTSKRVTVPAGETAQADFQLSAAAMGLDAVVVTGAGTETEKRKLGNTVGTIDAASLRNAPVANLSEQLAAREPGVSVLVGGGLTGEGAQIRIRGAASLTQANEPVVYVDGVRIDRSGGFGDNVGTGGGGQPSRLDDINPESIDRIEVLKGAAAATLYGTEASTGVIQIFTKRGARGAPRFDFLVENGVSQFPDDRYAASVGWVRTDSLAGYMRTTYNIPWPTVAELSAFYGRPMQPYEIIERRYIQRLFETGLNRAVSGSVSGGTPSVQYQVNGRFSREDGPLGAEDIGPARDLNGKTQASASLVMLPTDDIKIQVTSLYADVHQETPENNNNIYAPGTLALFGHPERAMCTTFRASSTPTGNESCTGAGNPFGNSSFATVYEGLQTTNAQDVKHYTGSLRLSYQPIPSLSLEGTLGVDVVNQLSQGFRPFGHDIDGFTNITPTGSRQTDDRTTRIITAEAKGTWRRQFGEPWSSVFVAGGQGFITKLKVDGAGVSAFPGPGIEVTGAAANQAVAERFLETVNAGVFAQEQVGYRDYAFLTLGGRYDRNSAFGKTSEGVFYPKASLSVEIPKAFPTWGTSALTSPVSTLRVRGAIGQSGLQPGAFDKFTTFRSLSSELGPGLAPDNLGNPNLRPEVSTEWELGTEIGLLGDRAGLEVTYWRRATHDALYQVQYPPSGGFRFPQLTNIAEIKSGGYDIALRALPISRSALSVRLFANATWMWEFVTKLGGAPEVKVGGTYVRYRNFVKEGFAPGALFVAQLPGPCSKRPTGATYLCLNPGENPYDLTGPAGVPDGLPDTDAQMLAYFGSPRNPDLLNPLRVDEDGDGNFLDHYAGKGTPDWQGSFGANATVLQNVELGALFEFKFGNYLITNLTDAFRKASPTIGRNLRKAAEVEVTLMNPASTPQERLDAARTWADELKALSPYDGLNQNESGAFLRFREVSVTYNVPQAWAQRRFGVRYVSITAAARNLALWTPYTGIDPELNQFGRGGASADLGGIDQNFGQGIDAFGYAIPRRFTFSVRFGF
jgi:TonB-linked SusC/RagA family outer membrane protein